MQIEQEISQYPEIGIINPFVNTKFCLTDEMLEFLDQYLLVYKDYPDAKIAKEFSVKFGILKDVAKDIEHDYVVVNRARICKRIEMLLESGKSKETIIKQIESDFGIDSINAGKYVQRCVMDGIDTISGIYTTGK